jgi:hypothetical protein
MARSEGGSSMTWRPRIRTIKPEMWSDEKIGQLSRDARLLFVGLITMADDEGRLRALPAAILGHVFPYDADATAARLTKWMDELCASGLVVTYTVADRPYAVLPGWSKHQKINRANPSELPPCPFNVTDVSRTCHGSITDSSVKTHGVVSDDARPRAQARAIADRDQDQGIPLSPPGGKVVKFDRKPVPTGRLELAQRLLADFNEQAGTSYGAFTGTDKPSDSLKRIIGALTQRPDVTEQQAHDAIAWQLDHPFWDGPAHTGVVFGPGVWDKALEATKHQNGRSTLTRAERMASYQGPLA